MSLVKGMLFAEPATCQCVLNMRHKGPKAVLFLELEH